MKWKVQMTNLKDELIEDLQKAVEFLEQLAPPRILMSKHESSAGLAVFVKTQILEFKRETIEKLVVDELSIVFYPTCDWDDCRGDTKLGDSILKKLQAL